MAIFSDHMQSASVARADFTAVVEASDIPILSATDRLQRTLLRWIDICGLSGQFVLDDDVVDALGDHDFLDDHSYVIEIESTDPARWPVIWAGAEIAFSRALDFREAFTSVIPEDRFIDLVAREYVDAVRYRRASARRFAHRDRVYTDTMDQLIFPIRDGGRSEFVLVVGEAVTGRSLYARESFAVGQDGETR